MKRRRHTIRALFVTGALSLCMLAADAADPFFVSPSDGKVVRPGEVVPVVIDGNGGSSSLTVRVFSRAAGIADLVFQAAPYESVLAIPEDLSGPVELVVFSYEASSNTESGMSSIILNVVPNDAPSKLLVDKVVYIEVPQSSEKDLISVKGVYEGRVERDLGHPGMGVTFESSDTTVATVDASGVITALVPGDAFIVVRQGATEETVLVRVRSPGQALPPVDQTSNVAVQSSGLRLDSATGMYIQELTVKNLAASPLPAPLVVVLMNLPSGVSVRENGLTKFVTPRGSPYVLLELPVRFSGMLKPNEIASTRLEFVNPMSKPITYTPTIYTASQP